MCEYAPFLAPTVVRGNVVLDVMRLEVSGRLAGNNFAVRRVILSQVDSDIHESEVTARIRELGGRISIVAEACVFHSRRYSLRQAVRDRLRFGFEFGRLCAKSAKSTRRRTRILGGPAILASQVIRLSWTLLRKRRGAEMILNSAIPTIALLTAWSVAEWLGWIVGPSRKSGEKAGRSPLLQIARARNRPQDCKRELANVSLANHFR